ncbi:restriction endonuclease subunit S [Flavobacterium sp.]|jgi:type I restriction enzyme S subunit|uniref:restriction endonuclease subunit S n=1 Tax=Flavobacterium sp. TaxID=239 RepID=UPI0037BFDDF3
MKQGWEVKTINELTTLFADGDWIESKDQSSEGIRLIQTGNVGNGFFKDRGEKARYISEDTFKRLRCTEIVEGDCLVSRLPDPVGRACLLPDTMEKMITSVDCTIIRFNEKKIFPKWFLNYSLSKEYFNKVQLQVTGSTRQRITRKNLGLIEIPIPPLQEQQGIVAILDEAFTAIDKAKANTEQNLKNVKELFESELQKVFSEKGDGWEEKSLEDCFKMKSGFNLTSKMMSDDGIYPVFGGNGIAGLHDNFNLEGSNVIIGRVGALCGNVRHLNEKIWLTDNAFKVVDKKFDFDDAFLTYLLNFIDLRSYARQAAQPVISNSSLKDVLLNFPKSLKEQQSIVSKLDALREQTKKLETVYEKKLQDLEELKKSVLQKAFSGELTGNLLQITK